jgi:hypothetical protein
MLFDVRAHKLKEGKDLVISPVEGHQTPDASAFQGSSQSGVKDSLAAELVLLQKIKSPRQGLGRRQYPLHLPG